MMRLELEREMLGRPVRSLQYMLRQLSKEYEFLPEVALDGVFGEKTLEAVMMFQREFVPPVTGVVDYRTWNAIRNEWEETENKLREPRAVRAFPGNGRQAEQGERYPYMVVPQSMFRVLSYFINGISDTPEDGKHGELSAENVRWLQEKAGLPVTGVLDQRTWDALSRLYEVVVLPSYINGAPLEIGWG